MTTTPTRDFREMATLALSMTERRQRVLAALIKTWLTVAVTDALFASAAGALVSPQVTPLRVFRGVAAVVLGRGSLDGGLSAATIGLTIHFAVALFWSALFVFAVRNWGWLRNALMNWPRAIVIASHIPFVALPMVLINRRHSGT